MWVGLLLGRAGSGTCDMDKIDKRLSGLSACGRADDKSARARAERVGKSCRIPADQVP
jgi:hypothetical protein